MSANSSLNQLKKKYRNRYYGYRVRDVSALEPGENVLSFLQQYLHISDREDDDEECTAPLSSGHFVMQQSGKKKAQSCASKSCGNDPHQHFQDREDDDEECTAPLSSGHFVMQQSGKKKGQSFGSKACGNDAHQHFQGAEHSFKQSNTPAVPQKNEKQSEISYTELFSDGESDNENTYEVAKLIEESLADHDDVEDDQLVNSSEKQREKLYSSDSSVVREPPSPTSNIHAKKWLSFKEATFGATHSVFANIVSTPSEESRKNAQQLKLPDAIKSNGADITYELHSEDDGLVIEDESRYRLNAWISSSKKKNAPQSPYRAKEDKPTTTPKKAIEAPSSVKKKSENIKESLTSNVTAKRLVIEDESRYRLNAWISSSKKKNASQSPSRAKEDKPTTTPKKAIEAPSSVKKKSENIKESLTSNVTAKRSNEEFMIEVKNRRNVNALNSPFKKQKSSPPAGPKKDSPTPTPKKIETPSSTQKKCETVKASLTSSVAVESIASLR
ncbi:altered inheritance of mitochondria protein 21-like [Bufo gargarizans]|uniref:altered inheritance of mitochondria protein 21-like n=1 Tax=Bufo gargarizans TaxID=30331 RepID=UPI001CF51F55|nr:altered inheritance of mitochondria protein 21-like [Bufo gargarizans]